MTLRIKPFMLIFCVCLSFSVRGVYAAPAAPDAFEIVQPDGTVISARVRGDEWNNRIETVRGHSIKKDLDGYWYYISHYDKDIPVLSSRRADRLPPQPLKKHIRPDRRNMRFPGGHILLNSGAVSSSADAAGSSASALSGVTAAVSSGRSILFILAEFADRPGTYTESSFASFISNNINDYFYEASYGQVTLSSAVESYGVADNGVIGWVNLEYNHPDTGGNTGDANRQLTYYAVKAADPFINFSDYDTDNDGYVDPDELAIVVIAAGFERAYSANYAPSVWGHTWSLGWGYVESPLVDGVRVSDYHNGAGGYAQFGEIHASHQATMGIMVHELGHLIFGLPDLYDTDGLSEGIGAFGIMGAGSWGSSSSDSYAGETPVLPSAWSKLDLGWITPMTGSGPVSIEAAGSVAATSANSVYKLLTPLSNEHFLVENRQPSGYDQGLERWLNPGFGGLAIWHIDENTIADKRAGNQVNTYECYPDGPLCSVDHYGVALEQADNSWHLEKNSNRGNATDLWKQTGSGFGAGSAPDSNLYNGTASYASVSNISASGTAMTAKMILDSRTLNLLGTGTGSGSVTSSPSGIDCGTDCSEVYEAGTVVTLFDTAGSESVFTGWGGDAGCSDGVLSMDTDLNCTATFNLVQYQLTTAVNPAAGGSISPDCSAGCPYDSGTAVVLTATENSGYFFDNWTNCDSASNNICTEIMDADDTLTAGFQACYEPVRIAGLSPVYYADLQAAYDAVSDGGTIQVREEVFTADLDVNRPVSVTIEGGYDCNYSSVTGSTTFNGTMNITDGSVTIGDFIFGN